MIAKHGGWRAIVCSLLLIGCNSSFGGRAGSGGVSRLTLSLPQTAVGAPMRLAVICQNGVSLNIGPFEFTPEFGLAVPACGPAVLELVIGPDDAATFLASHVTTLVDGQSETINFAAYPAATVNVSSDVACLVVATSKRSEQDAARVRGTNVTPGATATMVVLAGEHAVRCVDDNGFDRLNQATFNATAGSANTWRLSGDTPPPPPVNPPDPGRSSIVADRTSQLAPDGVDAAIVTVTVRDKDGVALSGVAVQPSGVGFSVLGDSFFTDAQGIVLFAISADSPGLKGVTFTAADVVLGSIALEFIDGSTLPINTELTLFRPVPFVISDTTDTTTAELQVIGPSGGNVVGARVVFALGPSFAATTPETVFTGQDGKAQITFRTTFVETEQGETFVSIGATVNNVAVTSASVKTEKRKIDQAQSSLSANGDYVPADLRRVQISVLLRDQKGRAVTNHPINGSTVPSAPKGTMVTFPAMTDGTGQASLLFGIDEPMAIHFLVNASLNGSQANFDRFVEFVPAIVPVMAPSAPFAITTPAAGETKLSGNGQFAVFVTDAPLSASDTNGSFDVYRACLRDCGASYLELVSQGAAGVGDGLSGEPSVSYDGSLIAFTSRASNLGAPGADSNASDDVYVRDMNAAQTWLVSVTTGDVAAGGSSKPAIVRSAGAEDGSHIVFQTTGVFPGFTSSAGISQIVRAVPDYGTVPATVNSMPVTLVSKSAAGNAGATNSTKASIANVLGNSRVVFETSSGDIVGQNFGSSLQVMQCDLGPEEGAASSCLSLSQQAPPFDANSFAAQISDDGTVVVMLSNALLSPSDTNGTTTDLYVVNALNGTVLNWLPCSDPVSGGASCASPRVSSSGRHIVFETVASRLAGVELNGTNADNDAVSDVYTFDREREQIRTVSERFDGSDSAQPAHALDIDSAGTLIVLKTLGELTSNPHQGVAQALYRVPNPLADGKAHLVSFSPSLHPNADGVEPNNASPLIDERNMAELDAASMSFNGRFVAFTARSSNDPTYTYQLCAAAPCNNVFWVDLLTRQIRLASVSAATAGASSAGHARHPSISDDGRYVVFDSDASDLVTAPAVAPGSRHVYRFDALSGQVQLVDLNSALQPTPGDAARPNVSGNGQFIAFEANAPGSWFKRDSDNVVSRQIYWRDMSKSAGDVSSLRLVSASGANQMVVSPLGAARASISNDGNLVAFDTDAPLLAADTNTGSDVYLRILNQNQLSLVSRAHNGSVPGSAVSQHARLSGDGSAVLFESDGGLVAGSPGPGVALYLRTVGGLDNAISVVSVGNNGVAVARVGCFTEVGAGTLDDTCFQASISDEGRYVAFVSELGGANTLTPFPPTGPLAGTARVYVHDRVTKHVHFGHAAGAIAPGQIPFTGVTNNPSYLPVLSGDGRFLSLITSGGDYGYYNNSINFSQVVRVTSPYFSSVKSENAAPPQL